MIKIGYPTKRAMIKTGIYTGNGIDNRNIDISINLAAKNNVCIILKSISSYNSRFRIEYGQGDFTMDFGAGADMSNLIQQLTSTGFQIGDAIHINETDILQRYIVFWEEP